jgi:hypothetical protein
MRKLSVILMVAFPIIALAGSVSYDSGNPVVYKPAPCILFEGDAGKLCWGTGEMVFTGNAEKSAKVFFYYLKSYVDSYMQDPVEISKLLHKKAFVVVTKEQWDMMVKNEINYKRQIKIDQEEINKNRSSNK